MTGGEDAQPPGGSSGDSVMVWVQDFDGYTLSINAAHRAVLGWSLDELSAVPFWELVHPDDQQRLMEDRERLLLRGPGRMPARRVRMLRRDGTHRLIACCSASSASGSARRERAAPPIRAPRAG